MPRTNIGWCDFTVNPLRARHRETGRIGHYCEKVSPGCTHCYASALQSRLFKMPPYEVPYAPQVEPFLHPEAFKEVLRRRIPTKFFWCSMTDLFGRWVPAAWIDACVEVMTATPQHIHMLLTKRPERMAAYFQSRGSAPPHVWPGTSVEDQARADERLPWLLQTPAGTRMVSYEPMLGPVDFASLDGGGGYRYNALCQGPPFGHAPCAARVDWIIAGGESGDGYQSMEVAWISDVIAQCEAAGVACYVKQDAARQNERQGRIPEALWAKKAWPLPL